MKSILCTLILLTNFNLAAEELFPVGRGQKYGYVDNQGEWVIGADFQDAQRFKAGVALVQKGDLYGYLNKEGKLVISPGFSIAYPFQEEVAAVRKGSSYKDLWGFIKGDGSYLIQPAYRTVGSFKQGLAAVQNNKLKFGFINKEGETIIKPIFNTVYDFSEGFAAVNRKEKWYFIDTTGQPLTKKKKKKKRKKRKKKKKKKLKFKKYYQAGSFSEGLAPVRNKKGKWGYINSAGKLVIKYKFKASANSVGSFFSGLARAKRGDFFGFINKKGKWVIPARYEAAGRFSEGLAAVKVKGKWGYINTSGKLVIKPYFTDPFYYPDRYFTDFFYRTRQGAYAFVNGIALPRVGTGKGQPRILKSDGSLIEPEE